MNITQPQHNPTQPGDCQACNIGLIQYMGPAYIRDSAMFLMLDPHGPAAVFFQNNIQAEYNAVCAKIIALEVYSTPGAEPSFEYLYARCQLRAISAFADRYNRFLTNNQLLPDDVAEDPPPPYDPGT